MYAGTSCHIISITRWNHQGKSQRSIGSDSISGDRKYWALKVLSELKNKTRTCNSVVRRRVSPSQSHDFERHSRFSLVFLCGHLNYWLDIIKRQWFILWFFKSRHSDVNSILVLKVFLFLHRFRLINRLRNSFSLL